MTTAVARPATTTAPGEPISGWACAGADGSFSIMRSSFQRGATQLVGLARSHRAAAIVPSDADVADHGSDLVVGQGLRERRHAVWLRVAGSRRRIAAV